MSGASVPSSATSAAPHALTRPQLLYLWLAAASVTCLLLADILGVKLFQFQLGFSLPFFGRTIEHTAGMLIFPVTFLITDWLNDYYGKAAARRVVLISAAMAMLAFAIIQVARALPHWDAPFNVRPEAFEGIFGSASVMYVASVTAYLINNLLDIFLFGQIKRATGGRHIWLRATGSTLISQLIDSFVVTFIAFWLGRKLFAGSGEPMGAAEIVKTALTGYTLKFCIAIAMTPVLYLGHGAIRRATGLQPLPVEAR
jgi:uncharacterized integral membrane protein (TIGR00697 family)